MERQKEKRKGRRGIGKFDKFINLFKGEKIVISSLVEDRRGWGEQTLKIQTGEGEVFSCTREIKKEIDKYIRARVKVEGKVLQCIDPCDTNGHFLFELL